MPEWLKKLIAFLMSIVISYIIFYSFFAMLGIAIKMIFGIAQIIVILIVAFPFYVLIKKKLLK